MTPVLIEDGDMLSLSPGRPEVTDSAPVGRLVLDGNRLVPFQGGVMGARRRMLYNGVIVASVAVDGEGRLRGAPKVSAPGLFDLEDTETVRLAAELSQALAELPAAIRRGKRRSWRIGCVRHRIRFCWCRTKSASDWCRKRPWVAIFAMRRAGSIRLSPSPFRLSCSSPPGCRYGSNAITPRKEIPHDRSGQ